VRFDFYHDSTPPAGPALEAGRDHGNAGQRGECHRQSPSQVAAVLGTLEKSFTIFAGK